VYRGDNTSCAAANCHVYSYTGAPVPIEDSTTANVCGNPAVAEIVINDSFTITDAQTGVFIAHTFQGDVNFKLTKVGGPTVTLVDRPDQPNTTFGFGNDNYGASATSLFRNTDSAASTYDTGAPGAPANNVIGNWKPESPLAAFIGQNAQGTWRLEVIDCYPGDTGTLNNFVLFLEGPSGPAPCYANCDGSTTPPILNVNDFICFQTKFAAQDPAANCDGSTTPPVLNVNDFICFQSQYAAGCP
jgi:subtilisin-like proprotein convertase family protein